MQKVLFVCLGNICRSPTAHSVLRQLAAEQGVDVEIESAGTSASHKGELPDPRSIKTAEAVGYRFNGIRSRPVKAGDFAYYDLILAMDSQNLADLTARCPSEHQHKLRLFMSYHPDFANQKNVPDPYYGGSKGFELVLRLIEQGCAVLIQQLIASGRSEIQ